MHAGYYEEAQAWRDWLLRAVAGSPEALQIMYGIGGERRLAEWSRRWLPGYENSAPVRIGNAAYTQLQIDVFGEIMDVHHQARRCGLSTNESGWDVQIRFLEHLADVWHEAGSRHVGNARPAAAFYLFQSDGVGWLRSCDKRARKRSALKARSINGVRCAKRSTTRSANAGSTANSAHSFRPMDRTSLTPTC